MLDNKSGARIDMAARYIRIDIANVAHNRDSEKGSNSPYFSRQREQSPDQNRGDDDTLELRAGAVPSGALAGGEHRKSLTLEGLTGDRRMQKGQEGSCIR